MGNRRTVHIAGTISEPHAALLADLLDCGPDWDRYPWESPLAPLSFSRARPGTYGLGRWPVAAVCRTGNLAWKEYEVAAVVPPGSEAQQRS